MILFLSSESSDNGEQQSPVIVSSNKDGSSSSSNISKDLEKKSNKYAKQRKNWSNKSNSNHNSDASHANTRFQCENLSLAIITSRQYNKNIIVTPFIQIKDSEILLSYSIEPNKIRLVAQANTWARTIVSSQNLDLRRIIGSRNDTWISELESAFIYSYFSCLLYSISAGRVSDISRTRKVIVGHGLMYSCLLSFGHTFRSNGFSVVYRFECDQENYDRIVTLAREFPFINDYLRTSPRFFLENERLERILSNLSESVAPEQTKFVELQSEKYKNYLTKDTFPIANSFYASNGNESNWYYSINRSGTILNHSTLFGKALFVTAYSSNLPNYYDNINADDNYSLIKYELSHICGSEFLDCIPPREEEKAKPKGKTL